MPTRCSDSGRTTSFRERSSLDLGYVHAFVKDASVNNSIPGTGSLVGTYDVAADVLGNSVRLFLLAPSLNSC